MSSQGSKPPTAGSGKRAAPRTAKPAKKTTPADVPPRKTRRKAATREEWSDKDIANVITLVQKNSVVYDTGHVDYYKGKDKRLDIWEDMAKELKLDKTGDAVKRLWTNLRRNFGKKLKEHPASGAGRQAVIESWPHWESMLFVKDHITPNESVSTLDKAKAAIRAGDDFSLVDATTDDEQGITGNDDDEEYDGNLPDDELPDIPDPPSIRSWTGERPIMVFEKAFWRKPFEVGQVTDVNFMVASTLSSGSKSEKRSKESQSSRQLDECEVEEHKLASQADELTKALGIIGAKADSPQAQYGSYVTATLLSQSEDDRKILRQKIQQAIALFLYEQATGFGFPVIVAQYPGSSTEHRPSETLSNQDFSSV
ncbi:hypothetical protein RvY_16245 [Ramazzottius varieornatus]|uniref:MADF domain-containing protein n=1 Tax=Ramazzottius varieornatus TaxID=947166 RepID=A0A1D1W4A1_RAMVA|nr:hypothetical protein RvY_16245 [Ramazzottius varieornatus]